MGARLAISDRKLTHLVKATGLVEIHAKADLPLSARRLFNHLLAAAYPRLRDGWAEAQQTAERARIEAQRRSLSEQEVERAATTAARLALAPFEDHQVPLVQLRRFAAEARDGAEDENNMRLKDSIRALQEVLVEFNYLRSDGTEWMSAQLLGPCEYVNIDGQKVLSYRIQAPLIERLIEPALYSYISLKIIYQFESKYSLILYEILKRYSDRDAAEPYWDVKSENLRTLMGCGSKYKDWKDFRLNVMEIAVEEISRLAEFRVEAVEARQGGGRGGGRVVGVRFRVLRKPPDEAEAAFREIEKPRFQRRAERLSAHKQDATKAALRYLDAADFAERKLWAERAANLGVALPPSPMARENLPKWVPAIAEIICAERNVNMGQSRHKIVSDLAS
jgi:hypothetical protein